MSSIWRTRLTWLLIGAVIAAVVYWKATEKDRASLMGAVARGEVSYSLKAAASDGEPSGEAEVESADLTVNLTSTGGGDRSFVLPAGTLIGRAGASTQRLMTAIPVAVHLSSSAPTFHQKVETYCLEPFKPPPGVDMDLEFDGEDAEYKTAQKLAGCLKDEGSHGQRQLAIWLVAQGYLDKLYPAVHDELLDHVRQEMGQEVNKGVGGGLEPFLRKQFPNASEEMIRRQLARYTPDKLSDRIDGEARDATDTFLKGFLQARDQLARCGYEPAKLAFFTSAPTI